MPQQKIEWLLSCADLLARERRTPISIRRVLSGLQIGLEKRVAEAAKAGTGSLVGRDGRFTIVLTRSGADAAPLSPRERFTLAHELAHVLLIKKFGWNPSAGPDYYECEEYCDRFAARLLVPDRSLSERQVRTAAEAIDALCGVAKHHRVSLEVAARRFVERHSGFALFQGRKTLNASRSPVFAIEWSAVSIPTLNLRRFAHVKRTDPLGALLLTGAASCNAHQSAFDAVVCEMKVGRRLVALREKTESIAAAAAVH